MDYISVYAQFIADRRLTEGSLEKGSYDLHHIKPRCLGGTDDPKNLIRLSRSDHLFAHALLARIHGGRLLTSLVRMSGMKRYRGRQSRVRFSFLRRRLSRLMEGNKRCVGRPNTPEATAKKKAAWTPEMRERQRQRMLGNDGQNHSQKARANMSAGQTLRWQRHKESKTLEQKD